MRTGELGYWWRSLGGPPPARAPLAESTEADVAIVGAGYTGLWTAYYLKRAQPSLRVVVLEAEQAGFGASGRNGGWVTPFFSGPASAYERRGGRAALIALQRAMLETVEEIARVLERERIDAELVRGGQLDVALDGPQAERLREHVRELRALGLGEEELRELDGEELAARVRVAGARAATLTRRAARVHPAKLLSGLAAAVERAGVTIHERTLVREIRAGEARADAGTVRARWVVRATEGYTSSLRGLRRALVPMNSSMIVTEPLAPAAWEEIGGRAARCWATRRTCSRTCSARPTGASRSAVAACPTASARAPTATGARRARRCGSCRRSSRACSRRRRACRSTTRGRACSASRATGA